MCRMWKVYCWGKALDSFASSRLKASTSRQSTEIVWNKFQDLKPKKILDFSRNYWLNQLNNCLNNSLNDNKLKLFWMKSSWNFWLNNRLAICLVAERGFENSGEPKSWSCGTGYMSTQLYLYIKSCSCPNRSSSSNNSWWTIWISTADMTKTWFDQKSFGIICVISLSGVQVQSGELQLPDEQNDISCRGFHHPDDHQPHSHLDCKINMIKS